ncbi:MAG: hypothetical protein JWR10_803, partial [Rubritepida sp.]|nr:hypothetical protein [Rubritepida sp.]
MIAHRPLQPPNNTSPSLELAELRRRILADEALPLKRRGDVGSSLNSLGKVVGLMLESIAADPVAIRPLLKGKTAAMTGLEPGRWRNVLADLSFALFHAGRVTIPLRIDAPPSPAWASLTVQLTDKHSSYLLSRFARCCTLLGVEPAKVTDAFMDGFLIELQDKTMVAEPVRMHREAILCFNEAVGTVAGWPDTRLTVPDNRLYYTPGWEIYPASLIAEIEAWQAPWIGDELFANLGHKPLSPVTLASRKTHLRLYLGALVLRGIPVATMTSLAAVITPKLAEVAYRFHFARAKKTHKHSNAAISRVVTAIADHWLNFSGEPLKAMRAMRKQLQLPKVGMTDCNKARRRSMEDEGRTDALLNLPL